jgi:squalene/oxidosqualene cyclase-like protein
MAAEDLQTNFIDIGPVNKVLNMISAYHVAGGDVNHGTVVNHFARVPDYMWVAEDGMKVKGYNGSQCWDTSFAIQAVYEAKLLDDFPEMSRKVWTYLERTQILSTEVSQSTPAYEYERPANRKRYYRHVSEGGWPFSTSAHGWPISDCTSEGLKGALCLMRSRCIEEGLKDGSLNPIGEVRLQNAVNVLLTYQNEDGGWATYENNRGFGWYEALNPSEVFGDIMIDYSYVECSMATLTALADFQEAFPSHRRPEIDASIARGCGFLKSIQRDDGSWYGSWACCFCYGVWFGVEGLIKCGEPVSSDCIKKACDFLLRHQRPNGGWGEDFTSCYNKDYAPGGMEDYGDEGSGVVNTAWALLALSVAKCDDVHAIENGIAYLMKRQLPSGDWPQEGIAGVFNRACGITYTAYRNVFPIWAIGRCLDIYGDKLNK